MTHPPKPIKTWWPPDVSRSERRWALAALVMAVLLPLLPESAWSDGGWHMDGLQILLAALWFSLPMALSLWPYLLARPAALAGAALANTVVYALYARHIYGTAAAGGGASFLGLLWLVFWAGCAAALLLPLSARRWLRGPAGQAALAGCAVQAAMFGLPWLLLYLL